MNHPYTLPPQTRVCAFTGHRDISHEEYRRIRPILQETIEKLYSQGVDTFIAGGALGFDTIAAIEVINLQRQLYPGMKLILAIPCEGQSSSWGPAHRARYDQIRSLATAEFVLSPTYTRGCMHRRNDFMIDHSSHLIAYVHRTDGGSAYTMNRARRQGLSVINLATPTPTYYPPLTFAYEQGRFEDI